MAHTPTQYTEIAPLPWSSQFNENRADTGSNIEIYDADGIVIARVEDNDTHEEALARGIVHAVNSHAALLEALKDILDYSGYADSALDDPYVMDRARQAIAQAEGVPS